MIQNTGLEIISKLEKLPLLASFVGNSMLKFGLGEYQQFQVQIAVEEAVKNIIKCGNLAENDKINIKCHKQDKEIKILINYPGKSFNPAIKKHDLNTSLKEDNNCLKVYFVKKNMNRINYEFEDRKNVLTLIKYI
jgi:serine/threonine-protein kinase RsbW